MNLHHLIRPHYVSGLRTRKDQPIMAMLQFRYVFLDDRLDSVGEFHLLADDSARRDEV
jgi:hypothetical protein